MISPATSHITNTGLSLALVVVALAGCTSTSGQETSATSGQETSASRSDPATTGPAALDSQSPRPTGTGAGAERSTPTSRAPVSRAIILTRQGLGGVPVGATLKDYAKALGRSPASMSAADRSVFADHSCVIRQLSGLSGVGLMVIGDNPQGRVRRISITAGSNVRTDKGIGLGSSMAAVRAAYGAGLDEPFDHFPVGGEAVLVRARDDAYLALIGDDLDRVAELRLGFKPEVLFSEGCV